jgi:hypothetical protein
MIEAWVRIGGDERHIDGSDAQWVNQSIQARLHGGENPCVEIRIRTDRVNVRLATPCCSRSFGGGRTPNGEEAELLNLWRAYGLDDDAPDLCQVWPLVLRLRRKLGLRAA